MRQPHIWCRTADVSPNVLLPGDPARVNRIAAYLDDAREVAFNREFRTVSGSFGGIPVTVTSTGIGGASLVIALEELIHCGGRRFIRTGSCGGCQSGIEPGHLVAATAAVREDGASRMYVPDGFPAAADSQLTEIARAVIGDLGYPVHFGVVRSHDSFYIDDEQERMAFWNRRGVLASDMETAALYVVAAVRGVQAFSLLNTVVRYEGDVKEGIGEYADGAEAAAVGEQREIRAALEILRRCTALLPCTP